MKVRMVLSVIFLGISLCFSFPADLPAQNSSPPPVKNYQDYLLMMKATNEAARERGVAPLKPLSRKEWENLRTQNPNKCDDAGSANSKSERIKYASFMGGKVSGPNSTTLILREKITPELQKQYSSDNDMILAWRDMGFKKVIFLEGKRSWSRNF